MRASVVFPSASWGGVYETGLDRVVSLYRPMVPADRVEGGEPTGMSVASRDIETLFSVGTLAGHSDGSLLERYAAHREEAAFEVLVRRHGPMVWGVCRRVLRDLHDAEDAFQATFLVLARKVHSIGRRDLVANWLYGVAYQTARKARSMRAKKRIREIQVADVPEPETAPQDDRDDLTEWLDRELSRLPDKYRIPTVLCELEGKTHREAAEQLGWPIGTVSGRLSRARALLARRLSRRGASISIRSLAVLLTREARSASLPAGLIGPTARIANLVAAGRAVAAGAVPAKVAALTAGVMKAMLLDKIKIIAMTLIAGCALAAGGTSLAYRASAADDPNRKDVDQGTDGQDRRIEVPRPGSEKSPIVLARAEEEQADRVTSYPFTIDPEKVYELPALTVDYRDFHLKAGRVSVVPIDTERGITGAMVIGDGTFRYAPSADKVIEGHFRAAMLRFNPDERAAIVPLEKGQRVSDRATWEMSRHLLQVVIRHCWQSNRDHGRIQEVLIPPKGAFAADVYSREHGDLLISFDERTATAYDFTERKALYEKK
jgi:RNA polymerase sigma factor (sigma-70 family)